MATTCCCKWPEYTHCLLRVHVLAVLEALNVLLGAVLLFLEVLITFDGRAKMKGEFLINNFVHCFSEWEPAVKDSELVRHEGWTDVVHRDGL
jgi:hypothetical protein